MKQAMQGPEQGNPKTEEVGTLKRNKVQKQADVNKPVSCEAAFSACVGKQGGSRSSWCRSVTPPSSLPVPFLPVILGEKQQQGRLLYQEGDRLGGWGLLVCPPQQAEGDKQVASCRVDSSWWPLSFGRWHWASATWLCTSWTIKPIKGLCIFADMQNTHSSVLSM